MMHSQTNIQFIPAPECNGVPRRFKLTSYLAVRVVSLSDSNSLPFAVGTVPRVSAANMNTTVPFCASTAQVRPRPPHC